MCFFCFATVFVFILVDQFTELFTKLNGFSANCLRSTGIENFPCLIQKIIENCNVSSFTDFHLHASFFK